MGECGNAVRQTSDQLQAVEIPHWHVREGHISFRGSQPFGLDPAIRTIFTILHAEDGRYAQGLKRGKVFVQSRLWPEVKVGQNRGNFHWRLMIHRVRHSLRQALIRILIRCR